PDETAGRAARCGHCMAVLRVPAAEEPVPYAELAPPEPPAAPPRPEPAARPRRRAEWPDRPSRRRTWLLASLLGFGGLLLLCCGGVYLAARPDWRTHDSPAGGFRVELPASPKSNMAHWAGADDPRVHVEGTVLLARLEDYGVVYVDIEPFKRRGQTDDAILDAAVLGMKNAGPGARGGL